MPAPISLNSGACSITCEATPLRASASAAPSPPMPPPMIKTGGFFPSALMFGTPPKRSWTSHFQRIQARGKGKPAPARQIGAAAATRKHRQVEKNARYCKKARVHAAEEPRDDNMAAQGLAKFVLAARVDGVRDADCRDCGKCTKLSLQDHHHHCTCRARRSDRRAWARTRQTFLG